MKSNNKSILMLLAVMVMGINYSFAQIKNAKTETLQVNGNCGTCKKNIETASTKKHVSKGVWDIDKKTLLLVYDSTKTNSDAILKNIALKGYDNEKYLASDGAYNALDACCQYPRKKPSQVTVTTALPKADSIKTDSTSIVSTVVVNPLADVYSAYFGLKNALTQDDAVTASAQAKKLLDAINAVAMDKLPNDQHTTWMKYQPLLSADAEQIKSFTAIEKQRTSFISLSKSMYEVMKVIKMDAPVYYDFCPMANGGKGANWLSEQQTIINPFYGKQMPTCGRVQETIK